jgi:putative oxidoreductase
LDNNFNWVSDWKVMERWLGKYSEVSYALMRLVVGLLFASHGAQKLFGVFGGQSRPANPLRLSGCTIEELFDNKE